MCARVCGKVQRTGGCIGMCIFVCIRLGGEFDRVNIVLERECNFLMSRDQWCARIFDWKGVFYAGKQ